MTKVEQISLMELHRMEQARTVACVVVLHSISENGKPIETVAELQPEIT